ncbi:importin subunit alpha-4-like [Drosophila sulfurigaster albostrigata]|uniref:importin subunit alpha-4-like n=1 Tax=Drosophila sulfurigaster albostrigata TaxID=89887 RepID=UPI002D21C8E5|nr:importin subunit alpha-4-like [Drosophila sulfurigaster albostrigata]
MDRHQKYKNTGKDQNEMRRRRGEVTVDLRKNKRDDAIMKRRNVLDMDVNIEVDELLPNSMNAKLLAIAASDSSHPEEQLAAVKKVRELVSLENAPVETLINNGMLPILVECIKPFNSPQLQLEAVWTLTNIASGPSELTHKVATSGAVPILVNLLSAGDYKVADQAIWALGNIIGDGPEKRDFVLGFGLIQPILNLLKAELPISFVRNIAWVIGNISRQCEPVVSQQITMEIQPALKVLLEYTDVQVVKDTMWAINNFTQDKDRIQIIVESGIVPKIVSLVGSNVVSIKCAAVNCLGNIVTGTDEQTQAVLDTNILSYFPSLCLHPDMQLRRSIMWFLSNIVAGTVSQIQQIIDANLIAPIIENMCNGDFGIQREAAYAIGSLCSKGAREQINSIIHDRVISPYCHLLVCHDIELIKSVLNGLKNMLDNAETNQLEVAILIEECGGLDKIESLQNHENNEIYKLAFQLIETYFVDNDEEDCLLPTLNSSQIQFDPNAGNEPGSKSFNF